MVEIKRNYEAEDFVFEATENGKPAAVLYGKIIDSVLHIVRYTGDKYLFDGVCRGALNNAEHEGADSAVIEESVPDWLLMLFNYKRSITSISDFFEEKNCDCSCNCGDNIV